MLCWGRLPTLISLSQWGLVRVVSCPLCGKHDESLYHLFVNCRVSLSIRKKVMKSFAWDTLQVSLDDEIKKVGKMANKSSMMARV